MSQPQKQGTTDLAENLRGAGDIMLGRESGLARMDLSSDGVVWSFVGLALAGLIDVSALSMLHNIQHSANPEALGKALFIAGHLVVALIGYGASMVALYLLCRDEAEKQLFATALTVHNWAAPLVSLFFSPLFLIVAYFNQSTTPENPNMLLNMVSIIWLGVLVFVAFRLIRISLNTSAGRAAALFAATTIVSLITVEGLEILFGLRLTS